jgi:ABC-type proline/glycine betaine transport system substrate-binding protein
MKQFVSYSLIALLSVFAIACSGGGASDEVAKKPSNEITLGNENWATSNVLTYMTKAVLEEAG